MVRKPTLETELVTDSRYVVRPRIGLPHAGEKPTTVQIVNMLGTSLEASTKTEDDTTNDDSPTSSKIVTSGTCKHSTEESACREHGNN